MRRLADGRVCFNWYRIAVTIPERVGDLDPTGATVVFEVVVDDYAEVWVDGELPLALGDAGGQVVAGFNAPNRVVLTRDARPGTAFQLAVFGINGPISASPRNYIWMRTASLEFHPPRTERGEIERVAGGFEFTEGPVWSPGRRAAVQLAEHQRDLPPRPRARARHRVPLQERLRGHRHRPLPPARLQRPRLLARRPADDLPARQPARDPRQPARRHHRARRRVRGPAPQQPQRPRLPLRRDAVLHRPAVRAPGRRSTTRPRSCRSAACSWSATARSRSSPTSSRARTGSRSRPTSAGSTSATGTPSTRRSCATTSPPAGTASCCAT